MSEYTQHISGIQAPPLPLVKNPLTGIFRRFKNAHSSDSNCQGSLVSEWSEWSQKSNLVLDAKSQAVISEVLDKNTGEIQLFKHEKKTVKNLSKSGLESRDERYKLQSVSRSVLGKDHRVSSCCRAMYHLDIEGAKKIPKGYAAILKGDKGGAFFGGLVTCGSVWACPVCGSKISQRRGDEMRSAMLSAENKKLSASLMTLTIKHGIGDGINDLLPKLAKAQVSFWGRRVVKDTFNNFGLVGRVRGLEVTYGASGWHPHIHVLLFSNKKIPKYITNNLAKQWQKSCLSAGLPKPNMTNGLDIRNGESAGEYICKFGEDSKLKKTKTGKDITWDVADEITQSHSKKGRQGNITPFDMLRLIRDSESSKKQRLFYRARFEEYAKAFKGRRQLVWSRGLRDELGLEKELTDEELALEMKEESNVVMLIDKYEMKALNKHELRATSLALAESKGGVDAVARMLFPLIDTKGQTFESYKISVNKRLQRKEFNFHTVVCGCAETFSFKGASALCPSCATRAYPKISSAEYDKETDRLFGLSITN